MVELSGFDANNYEPTSARTPLPEGKYTVVIIASELKKTRSGSGAYLELTLEIIGGEHNGRKIWDRLNIDNPSPAAKEIALRTLATICRCVDVMTPSDSSDLHDRPMIAVVRCKQDGDRIRNEVAGYEPVIRAASGGSASQANGNGNVAASGDAGNQSRTPW